MKKPILGDKTVMKRYGDLLADIKTCIRQAQNRAVMSANAKWLHIASRGQPTDAESLWMVIRTNISPAKSSLWVLPPA